MVRPAARALGTAMRWVVSTKPESVTVDAADSSTTAA
jgi:hypothetical protein